MNEFIFDNYEDHKIMYKNMTISAWSPKLDLIALGSINGDLCLYRLQMILIWKVNVKSEGIIQSLCWHPDGNLLAVGFKNGLIQFYSVKYPYCLYDIKYVEPITYIQWISLNNEMLITEESDLIYNIKEIFPLKENVYKNSIYKEEIKRIEEILLLKENFSVLIGVKGMSIFVLCRGLFNLGEINLPEGQTSLHDKIYNVTLSPNFDSVSYAIRMQNENGEKLFRTYVLNCDFIRENLHQLSHVSSHFVDIIYLRLLIQKHMKEIEESWEDCLNLFERGIMEYSKKKQHIENWSLKTDFMEMILFGCCNKEFWKVLEENLTLCDMKAISNTVHKMSSHIINHCCPNMHFTLMRLLFHTNELLNMLTFPSEYGFLNLSRDLVAEIADACGSTMLKLHEFQTILSDNIENLNLFFQWINNGIDNHLGEINMFHSFKYPQLCKIMDFVTNHLQIVKGANGEICGYKIEIVHQYLMDDDLSVPQLNDNDFFLKLIQIHEKRSSTDDSIVNLYKDGFFHIRNEKSLRNMIRIFLPSTIDKIYCSRNNSLINNGSSCLESYPITLAKFNGDFDYDFNGSDEDSVLITAESFSDDIDKDLVVEGCAFFHPRLKNLIWTQNRSELGSTKSCIIYLDKILSSDLEQDIKIIQLQFYNHNTLFLLVSVETTTNTMAENSYILVLSWSTIESIHGNKIREHSFNELINEGFTLWPPSMARSDWIDLSSLLNHKTQESLPVDAVDMTISCRRRLALVFFGKSREKCRIFVLEDI